MKPSIALIGPGKVGCAVTQRLHLAGYPISAVISRKHENAADACCFIGLSEEAAGTDLRLALRAEIILLAVPDDQISNLAADLAEMTQSLTGKTLVHFSGLHQATCMRTHQNPAAVLSIHPLLPFANRQLASEKLSGCPCALEGDEQSLALGTRLIEDFNGHPFRIDTEKKKLYHTGACVASNYFVTLLATARDLLTDCGVAEDEALPLLLPLVRATIDNVASLGPEQGLTGPIVRGDLGTVEKHLSALSREPDNLKLYCLLGSHTVALAEKSTRLPNKIAAEMRKIIASIQNS